MNKIKLNITQQAKNDIKLIADYIAKDNKNAAKSVLNYLYRKCKELSLFPDLGKIRSDFVHKNYRFLVLKKRYMIVYRVEDNNLFILRVLVNYQDICRILI